MTDLVVRKPISLLLGLTLICGLLVSCASSEVSRQSAANVDMGVQNAKNLADGATSGDVVGAYQNSSQTTKGVLLGGATGATVGYFSSGVGVIPGAAVGAIMGGAYGKYIDSLTNLKDQLENRGVVMLTLGDQMLVMLPSSSIFNERSGTINPEAYSTLKLTSQYISNYRPMSVKVAAYTDDSGSPLIDKTLSQQQADAIVKFLTYSGTNARMIYGAGYNGSQLIEKNSANWSGNDNYRIEITFQKLPA